MRWYRTKFVLALIALIVLEEVTPFVPLFGFVIIAGCCYPRFLLGFSRAMLRFYDAKYGTTLAGRIPSHVVLQQSAVAAPVAAER